MPKLTRHTGVGNGLVKRLPFDVSNRTGFEMTHDDSASCIATHAMGICTVLATMGHNGPYAS